MPGFSFPTVGPVGLGSPPSQTTRVQRYYDPLRLPHAHPRRVRSSLSTPGTSHTHLLLCPKKKARISGWVFSSYAPGSWKRFPHRELYKETNGSPEFPRQPYECMPWSLTPVVTSTLAIACPGLLPSSFLRPSAFTSNIPEAIIRPRLPICRGRDIGSPTPPAQIPASAANALGS